MTFPLQKVGWTAKALPASLLLLHRSEQCWQTGERRPLQQHGAAQYPHAPTGQLYLPEPYTQTTTHHPHTEDTLIANSAHGEQGRQLFPMPRRILSYILRYAQGGAMGENVLFTCLYTSSSALK